ncbi:hypothetical protein AGLY_007094, partial [Aphis glycines]
MYHVYLNQTWSVSFLRCAWRAAYATKNVDKDTLKCGSDMIHYYRNNIIHNTHTNTQMHSGILIWYLLIHSMLPQSMLNKISMFDLFSSTVIMYKLYASPNRNMCDLFRVPPETMDGPVRVYVAGDKDSFLVIQRPLMGPPVTLASLTKSFPLIITYYNLLEKKYVQFSTVNDK